MRLTDDEVRDVLARTEEIQIASRPNTTFASASPSPRRPLSHTGVRQVDRRQLLRRRSDVDFDRGISRAVHARQRTSRHAGSAQTLRVYPRGTNHLQLAVVGAVDVYRCFIRRGRETRQSQRRLGRNKNVSDRRSVACCATKRRGGWGPYPCVSDASRIGRRCGRDRRVDHHRFAHEVTMHVDRTTRVPAAPDAHQ